MFQVLMLYFVIGATAGVVASIILPLEDKSTKNRVKAFFVIALLWPIAVLDPYL